MEEKNVFRVSAKDVRRRLDLFLTDRLPSRISRSRIQKLIKSGAILVNGSVRKSHYSVEGGDVIEVGSLPKEEISIRPEKIALDIIHEDEKIIVINKPAGMVVHPAPGNYSRTVVNALLYHTKRLSDISKERPGIIHRLDKDTSGVLVAAKDALAHAFIARQFKKRTIDKRYLVFVEGTVQLDNGEILAPIARHARDRKRMAVNFTDGKEAATLYRVVERYKTGTLLEIKIQTGRTHQIRVHLAYFGHPVVGDRTYGTKRTDSLIRRQALHSSKIVLLHPETKERVSYEAEMPQDMKRLMEKLKK